MTDKTALYKDAAEKADIVRALAHQNTFGLKPEERIAQQIEYDMANDAWLEAERKKRQ